MYIGAKKNKEKCCQMASEDEKSPKFAKNCRILAWANTQIRKMLFLSKFKREINFFQTEAHFLCRIYLVILRFKT